MCDNLSPTNEELANVLETHCTATVLTFTRHAAGRINNAYISKVFSDDVPLTTLQCDDELSPCPIYRNMRVLK
jgi:hypothetical protein